MLLDHFHSPLKEQRPWTGFHSLWASKLAVALSHNLPDGWFAAPTVHWAIEVDVATFEEQEIRPGEQVAQQTSTIASTQPTAIPAPTQTIDFAFTTDVVEVEVYRDLGELTLVGAIELVSPANKDRQSSRDAFVAKCDTLLRDAVGLVVIDIVTNRQANLHADLMRRFGETPDVEPELYAVAYRPFPSESGASLSIWYRPLQVGGDIPPTLLFLKDGPIVELPLTETYQEVCRDLKVPQTF